MIIKIVRKVYVTFVLFLSFILLIGFSFGSKPIPLRGFIMYITLFAILLIIPIIYNAVKKPSDYKNKILSYIIIFVCFWLFLSFFNLIYGYGGKFINNKPIIGIFTGLGIPYNCGVIIFSLACILLIAIYMCNTQLAPWAEFFKRIRLFITVFFSLEIASIIILTTVFIILSIENFVIPICILMLLLCLMIYYIFNAVFTIKLRNGSVYRN